MALSFTPSEFLEPGDHCDAFDALLFRATSQKAALSLALTPTAVTIACGDSSIVPTTRLELSGVSQLVLDRPVPNASQVFYPLLGQVQSIAIPANKIFALRSHNRSVADFWARNLFHALSSTSDVSYVEQIGAHKEDGASPADGLAKRYLWVLRDALPDSNLKRDDALEKLTLDFYFPVIAYENAILQSGMRLLRRANTLTLDEQRLSDEDQAAAQRFNLCRGELLDLLVA